MSIILLMDGNNLANRAWYTTGKLTDRDERRMGVWFGMMETAHQLCNRYETNDVVWFFDGGHAARTKIFPDYKKDRQPETDQDKADKADLWQQLDAMIGGQLQALGFNNVHRHKGHEADDLIAQFIYDEPTDHEQYVIVSSDKDLYQLLMPHVKIYNAHSMEEMTLDWFTGFTGLQPETWPKVKAIVGGKESIVGVDGVGPGYAIKWLKKELNPKTKTAQAIVAAKDQILFNYQLCTLPIAGTPSVPYQPNSVTVHAWQQCCERLGFDTVVNKPPMYVTETELPRRPRRGKTETQV